MLTSGIGSGGGNSFLGGASMSLQSSMHSPLICERNCGVSRVSGGQTMGSVSIGLSGGGATLGGSTSSIPRLPTQVGSSRSANSCCLGPQGYPSRLSLAQWAHTGSFLSPGGCPQNLIRVESCMARSQDSLLKSSWTTVLSSRTLCSIKATTTPRFGCFPPHLCTIFRASFTPAGSTTHIDVVIRKQVAIFTMHLCFGIRNCFLMRSR